MDPPPGQQRASALSATSRFALSSDQNSERARPQLNDSNPSPRGSVRSTPSTPSCSEYAGNLIKAPSVSVAYLRRCKTTPIQNQSAHTDVQKPRRTRRNRESGSTVSHGFIHRYRQGLPSEYMSSGQRMTESRQPSPALPLYHHARENSPQLLTQRQCRTHERTNGNAEQSRSQSNRAGRSSWPSRGPGDPGGACGCAWT